MTRDFIGYGATPPHAHWPGNARIAVNFVILCAPIRAITKRAIAAAEAAADD